MPVNFKQLDELLKNPPEECEDLAVMRQLLHDGTAREFRRWTMCYCGEMMLGYWIASRHSYAFDAYHTDAISAWGHYAESLLACLPDESEDDDDGKQD